MKADAVEARLRAVGTAARAAGSKRYLKSDLAFVGATVPQVREEARGLAAEVSSRRELRELALDLWGKPVFERRACAAYLLDARVDLIGPRELPMLRRLVAESGTWALVDPLSAGLLGKLLVRRPELGERLDRWTEDRSFWVRRAALLSQIKPLKRGASFERFGRYADAMLDEKEFFVRKAIGWVLREAGKSRADEVYGWLLPRAARASGVTMREAVKYLEARQREALLAARAGRPPGGGAQ